MASFFDVYGGLFLLGMRYRDLDLYLAQFNLNTRQFLVIAAAQTHDDPPTFHMVAELLGLSYNSVKQVASQLEAMGYAELVPDVDDPRKQRIRLTEQNTEFWSSHESENQSFMETQFNNLPPDEAEQLFMILGKLFRN